MQTGPAPLRRVGPCRVPLWRTVGIRKLSHRTRPPGRANRTTGSRSAREPGDPDPSRSSVAVAKANIEAGNIAIKNLLPLIFSTSTNITYNELGYPLNSNAKVVCLFNTGASIETSVRRFRLIDDPLHPGINIWKWYDIYYTPSLSTTTNIVKI